MTQIKYYDNKEEHGMIIDWSAVFKEYHRIIKKAKVHDPIFDPSTAPVLDNKFFVYMSERASGKTTNWLLVGMILYKMYGTIIQYIRQTEDMIKPSVAGEIFRVILTYGNGMYVKEVTDGKYSGIYIHWKKAYFCNYDDNGKVIDVPETPFLSFLSIDNNFDYKSTYNAPTGDLIMFDEFISKFYRPNEFCDFMDLCSTIIRKRKTPIIVMLANTIDPHSTYFKELEISREIKKLKVGEHRSSVTEKGTHIYFEIIGLKQSAIKTQINRLFYGFNNPRLTSITGGEQTWSFDPAPHIVHVEGEEVLDKSIRIDCGDAMLQVEIVSTDDRGVIVNCHECSNKIYDDTIILTNDEIRDLQHIYGLGRGQFFKWLWTLYADNKWYYDTNETASMVKNYIKTYRTLRVL